MPADSTTDDRVKLTSGELVSATVVRTTLGLLHGLAEEAAAGDHLFRVFLSLCRGYTQTVSPEDDARLRDWRLIQPEADGVHDDVRAITLCAVSGDGPEFVISDPVERGPAVAGGVVR